MYGLYGRVRPVSYTHLDVYKRQNQCRDCVLIGEETGEASEFIKGMDEAKAVTEEEIQSYCETYKSGE